jgi:hypothetical protein
MGGSTAWYDLNKDGQRLEYIIRQMNTKMKKLNKEGLNEDNISLYFAYLDRLVKTTNSKVAIAETVLNVKGFLQLAKKQYGALPTEPGVIKVSHE